MREILFRGKRKDNGEWIEGIPIRTYDTEIGMNLPLRYKPKNITLMNNDRVLLCCAMDDSAYFDTEDHPIIDDETIGQYTGLTDKNGTKIFEGDIVQYVRVDIDGSEDTYIGAICFEPEKAGFAIKRDDYRAFFVNSWLIDIEVIGNIYDNPELMGGEAHG